MTGGLSIVRHGGLSQDKFCCDWRLRPCGDHSAIEVFEHLPTVTHVVTNQLDTVAGLRLRVDSIREGHSPSASHGVDAALERLAARKPQHGVHAPGRKLMSGRSDVSVAPVDDRVRTQALYKVQPIFP